MRRIEQEMVAAVQACLDGSERTAVSVYDVEHARAIREAQKGLERSPMPLLG